MSDEALSSLMQSADPAMVVVTTAVNGELAGCLVGFHAQASIDPERYCLWLSKANHTYRVALRSSHLGVHFLTVGDRDLAQRFGTRSGDDIDKFSDLATTLDPRGVPVLTDCPHRLVVQRHAMLDDGGDHICVVTTVVSGRTSGAFQPLRLSDVGDLQPGHESRERPGPATERAAHERARPRARERTANRAGDAPAR